MLIWNDWKNATRRLRLWFTQNKDTAANYLQIIVIVGGVIGFLWQIHDKNVSDRNQQAFTFIARYYQEPLASARQKVESIWYDQKFLKSLEAAAPNKKDDVILNYLTQQHLQPNIMSITDYFLSVQSCVKAGTCDASIACSMLKSEVSNFYDLSF